MKSPARLLLVAVGGLWLQAPLRVTASCGLCLFSGEACPYVYSGFSGAYCGMFTDSSGFSTECCCPNTMACAATATTCQCTVRGASTPAPTPTPAPSPTTSSVPTTAAPTPASTPTTSPTPTAASDTVAPEEKPNAVTIFLSVLGAVTAVAGAVKGYYKWRSDKQQPRKGKTKPANAKVQNAAPVDLATEAVVQLAQIVLNKTKETVNEKNNDDDEDS